MAKSSKSAKRAKRAHSDTAPTRREPEYNVVHVERLLEVERRRIKLPACMMEQEIVDAVKHNDIVVITGDTGCGKSTQVPQFLYENGLCTDDGIIGVTQVRRVACLALYQQVSLELNSKTLVGYQYRFNRGFNQRLCKIKFMTDGILLQEIKEDLLCTRYSVIIIDEAHERNLNCDILIGVLSRVVQVRREQFEAGVPGVQPLKLVIMSATIRAEDFLEAKIFNGKVAHLHIATEFKRNTIHFARRSVRDYVADAQDKVLKIHQRLPPGSVLVFLTGKDELYRLKRLLSPYEQRASAAPSAATQQPEEPDDDDAIFELESDSDTEDEQGRRSSNKDDSGDDNMYNDDNDSGNKEKQPGADGSDEKAEGLDAVATDAAPVANDENQDADSVQERGGESGVQIHIHGITTETGDHNMVALSENDRSTTVSDSTSSGDRPDPSKYSNAETDLKESKDEEDGANRGQVTDKDDIGDVAEDEGHLDAESSRRVITGDSDTEPEDEAEKAYHVELEVLSRNYKRLSDIKWHGSGAGAGTLRVVVMHASQTMDAQMTAFTLPSDNERVVILSTNVAETAITLPNIRYVVDCGKEKRRVDDISRGVSRFVVCDISKASAGQRSGRAGRVGSGHCYRQYTSSTYETLFDDYSPVEIANCNLESTILLLSAIGIENPYDFPFLTPPPLDNIRSALQALAALGAIETPRQLAESRHSAQNEVTANPFKIPPSYPYKTSYEVLERIRAARITQLGRYLALLPLHPRFGKMLYSVVSRGANADDLRTACCVISALSFGAANLVNPRIPGGDDNRKPIPSLRSDVELFIWICCRYSQTTGNGGSSFCSQYDINERLLREVFQQAEQLYRAVRASLGSQAQHLDADWSGPLSTPNRSAKQIIEAAIVECLVDKVAVHASRLSNDAHAAATNAYRTSALTALRRDVFLPRTYSRHKPECVVYVGLVGDEKIKMQDVLPTDAATICTLRSPMIVANSIHKALPPRYNAEHDCVEAFVNKVYAPLEFPLGIAKAALNPDHPLATRTFAQQLCLGNVFPALRQFSGALIVSEADFLAPTKAKGPLATLLLALRRSRVSSRATFLAASQQDANFLLHEFRGIIRAGHADHQAVEEAFRSIREDRVYGATQV
ncbi:RNA helicase, putative [Babesia bigemina]|uniref:RNA helicase n=1 Tax=Babesia bigemina TaxID=5866 RepID=A0A061D6E0_BABBI|nr:RNA helicase, putative [Babesia bigemina]CDR94499.1 RNA helicase, putative [Babesia bigemina]|eukprot:XP_012766685.1 RNA helicase, putative [Babesia bigemina]